MMHVKLVCYGAEPVRVKERGKDGGRGRKKITCLQAYAVKQRQGVLKLLDKDMFNWAIDNSFFFLLYGASLCCFEECGEERKKRMGWGNL